VLERAQLFRDTYAKCEPADAARDNGERTHEYSCLLLPPKKKVSVVCRREANTGPGLCRAISRLETRARNVSNKSSIAGLNETRVNPVGSSRIRIQRKAASAGIVPLHREIREESRMDAHGRVDCRGKKQPTTRTYNAIVRRLIR